MHKAFVKTVVDGYMIDRSLPLEKKEELQNYLFEFIDSMKEHVPCAYDMVYENGEKYKQEFIYFLLDDKLESVTEGLWEVINDPYITAIGILIGMLWFDKYYMNTLRHASEKIIKIKMAIYKMFENKEQFREITTVEKILSSNFSDCQRKIGFSLEGIKARKAVLPFPNFKFNGVGTDIPIEDIEQARNLLNCILDHLSSSLAVTFSLYVKCIKDSGGDFNRAQDMGITSIYLPTTEGCEFLLESLKEQNEEYGNILKVIYKDDPERIKYWTSRLNEKLVTSKTGEYMRPYIPRTGGRPNIFVNPTK